MTNDRDDQLAAWLGDSVAMGSDLVLERAFAVTRQASQRPGWLVAMTGGTIGARSADAGVLRFGWAVVAVIGMLVVLTAALVVGGLAPDPAPSPVVVESLQPSPSEPIDLPPSEEAQPSADEFRGLVAYVRTMTLAPGQADCTETNRRRCSISRIWVANGDGSGAHELMPGQLTNQQLIAWSPDGTRLLHLDDGHLALVRPDGSERELLPQALLCPVLVEADNCQATVEEGVSFSPDGARLAYVIYEGNELQDSTVVILDLVTGQVTRLESTRTNGPIPCTTAASEGVNEFPRWSTDGTRLVVARQGIGPVEASGQVCRSIIFSVNAAGTDLRVIVPSDGRNVPLNASWSPDDSRIVFHSSDFLGSTGPEPLCDIGIVRPDGSDRRWLTSDGVSCWPRWTEDGRIVFLKWTNPERSSYDLWIMDGDGANPTRLDDTSIAALTAVGCVSCPAQDADGGEVLWQPTPDR